MFVGSFTLLFVRCLINKSLKTGIKSITVKICDVDFHGLVLDVKKIPQIHTSWPVFHVIKPRCVIAHYFDLK